MDITDKKMVILEKVFIGILEDCHIERIGDKIFLVYKEDKLFSVVW